ncbi:MAG: long-chain fatty acid--CoA ligase [Bacteroidales bacterium]|jgi:long-chain acyl-CoA synthetase|nr:AMP-binding protein [Bacteroidales bacterium]MCK9498532.1 AMP-binding protein [Bacteroidales bacterium]MDY0313783.1 AMP-binding protein [Bacteroidales bacterium]NLB86417.1 long-chain fatty acid--CoA ligase [Bacteroidales bacterium]
MNANLQLNIPSFLNNSFSKFGNKPFLGFSDEKALSYSEVKTQIDNIIYNLEKIGVKKESKIAILSNNMPNWAIIYFASVSMGAVLVPILPDFSKEEIKNILQHSEAKILFVSEVLKNKVEEIETDFLETIYKTNDFSLIRGDIHFNLDKAYLSSTNYYVDEEDLALLIYTSGTTGQSKGVMLTHKNICFNARQSGILMPIFETDKFLSFLPLSHAYENTLGLILPMLNGASIYYLRKLPTPAVLIPAMQEVKPSIMLSVPLIIEKIYKNKILPSFNSKLITRLIYKIPIFRKILNSVAGRKLMQQFGGNLRFFGIGGAKLDSVVEKFLIEAKFPYAIGYGLTETSPLVAGLTPDTIKLNSTGPKIQGIEVKLHDINPKTNQGEIWVKGDSVMKGYYKDIEATNQVLTKEGWFKTGDIAKIDKNGYVFIKGRIKNVIIGSSGENIYPEEIESVINNFEFVIESVVLEEKGRLVALVHLNMEDVEAKYKNFKEDINLKIEEIKANLLIYINSKVNKVSAIKTINIQKTPFEKTPTQKIKRYLYSKYQK